MSTRPKRSSTPSTKAPRSSISRSAAPRPRRSSRRRSSTQRSTGSSSWPPRATSSRRQPGRVPGSAPPARRLERPRRIRPCRRRNHEGRDARVLLEHGLVDLACRPWRERLRRGLVLFEGAQLAPVPAARFCPRSLRLLSDTSFAAPQVAGAASLVWAANPTLTRDQVAWILKRSASGDGRWTKGLGYGVLDVGRAVATAQNGGEIVPPARAYSSLRLVGSLRRQAKRTRVRVRARLRSQLSAISPAGRRVSLQVRRNGKWHRIARSGTKAGGRALLQARLQPGRYVLRVKFAGVPELAEAASGRFVIRVRR